MSQVGNHADDAFIRPQRERLPDSVTRRLGRWLREGNAVWYHPNSPGSDPETVQLSFQALRDGNEAAGLEGQGSIRAPRNQVPDAPVRFPKGRRVDMRHDRGPRKKRIDATKESIPDLVGVHDLCAMATSHPAHVAERGQVPPSTHWDESHLDPHGREAIRQLPRKEDADDNVGAASGCRKVIDQDAGGTPEVFAVDEVEHTGTRGPLPPMQRSSLLGHDVELQ